jgi:hypothetical protein
MREVGHGARMGQMRNVCNILFGHPEGKRPLGRPRIRWEDNIRMYPGEIGCKGMDWIHLADRIQWQAVVNTVMNPWVP